MQNRWVIDSSLVFFYTQVGLMIFFNFLVGTHHNVILQGFLHTCSCRSFLQFWSISINIIQSKSYTFFGVYFGPQGLGAPRTWDVHLNPCFKGWKRIIHFCKYQTQLYLYKMHYFQILWIAVCYYFFSLKIWTLQSN